MPALKKAGVYAYSGERDAEAFIQGLGRHGVRPYLRNPDPMKPDQIERFDLVFVSGARGPRGLVRALYAARGVPVVIGDLGFLKRFHNSGDDAEAGHWQLSLGGLNAVPSFDCPSDRFDRLRLTLRDGADRPADGFALLAGQVPEDASHGHNATDLAHIYRGMVGLLENQGFEVVFRPHPRRDRPGVDFPHPRIDTGPLPEALKRASIVVTLSSNIGHDALLMGRPVSALMNLVPYADFVTPIGAARRAVVPDLAARRAYFARVAYAQWTLAEIRRGDAFAFLLESLSRGVTSWKPS